MKYVLVASYLAAIVLANQLVTGHPSRAPLLGFLFIGWDLVARDRLHDLWRDHLLRNMALLILAGSALSVVVNLDSARVALASAVAFGAAATADGIVYQWRHQDRWEDRAMTSNVVGAAVDSFVFPAIAFLGVFFTITSTAFWTLVFTLFCAKVAGSWLWTFLLKSRVNDWEQRNKALYGHLGK